MKLEQESDHRFLDNQFGIGGPNSSSFGKGTTKLVLAGIISALHTAMSV
jgi:hypothetical protein